MTRPGSFHSHRNKKIISLFDILFFTARSAVFSGCHGWAEHAVKGIVLPRGFRFAGRRRIGCLHRKAWGDSRQDRASCAMVPDGT